MVTAAEVAQVAGAVPDPEIPVVTIADLGILRGVRSAPPPAEDAAAGGRTGSGRIVVTITPTYSGCPAMDAIACDITTACARHGWRGVEVETVLSPAWTTDWITDEGRRKLREFGIAPPAAPAPGAPAPGAPVALRLAVRCPRCASHDTREISRFGSTACKALYVCNACAEPFDWFKEVR